MNIIELTWTEAEGIYTLAVAWPEDMQDFEQDEIERIFHVHGFVSEGNDRWTAPDDPSAPLEAWQEIGRYGYACSMAVDGPTPPAIEAALATYPMH